MLFKNVDNIVIETCATYQNIADDAEEATVSIRMQIYA